jgi:MFS family permease
MDEAYATDVGTQPTAGRSSARLLTDRRFGPYWVGKVVSLIGLWAHNLICAVVGYQVTGSVTFVGLISLAQFGPQLLLASWSGAVADRANRVTQVIVGRGLSCLASGALALWCLGGLDRPGTLAFVIGSSFLMGLGLVIGGPAMMALVPSLVSPSEIPAAVRLDSLPMLIGRTVGPALGALLLTQGGPVPGLTAAAAANAAFMVVLLAIRPRSAPTSERPEDDRSMRAALALVRAQPRLALLLVGVTATSFGSDPSITLAPAIADANGLGEAAVGLYSGAFGLGAAFAVVAMGPVGRRVGLSHLVTGGLVLLALSCVAIALPIGLVGTVGAFTLGGAGMSVAMTGCTTLLQLAVPDEFRGRVMSLWLMGFVGSRPLAALVNGALADVGSVSSALIFVAVVVALAAWLTRPSRLGQQAPVRIPDGRTS